MQNVLCHRRPWKTPAAQLPDRGAKTAVGVPNHVARYRRDLFPVLRMALASLPLKTTGGGWSSSWSSRPTPAPLRTLTHRAYFVLTMR